MKKIWLSCLLILIIFLLVASSNALAQVNTRQPHNNR